MKGTYAITADAVQDLADIENYVYSYSGDWGFVDALLDELEELFERLCENPYAAYAVYQFPEGYIPAHECRSANIRHYKVFYCVEAGDQILIYRIRHQASDFTRLPL